MFEDGYLVVAHACRPRRVVLHLPGNDSKARIVPFGEGRVAVEFFWISSPNQKPVPDRPNWNAERDQISALRCNEERNVHILTAGFDTGQQIAERRQAMLDLSSANSAQNRFRKINVSANSGT